MVAVLVSRNDRWTAQCTVSASAAAGNECNSTTYGVFAFDPVMGFPLRVSRYANPAPVEFWIF